MYLRQIAKKGETILLRRGGKDYPARAFVTDNYANADVSVVEQGKRVAIVIADDVGAARFPLPIKARQDRLVWGAPGTSTFDDLSTL